jgi:predicted HAD superfamily Cof-like phosphohydrolase
MTNPFEDQERFMLACDQTVAEENIPQYQLYLSLINEEAKELVDAIKASDKQEQLDALIDILVVTIGAIHSMGADGEGAWSEVMSTNFAKIDEVTGKVNKRSDGKILKPKDWESPKLEQYLQRKLEDE